MKSFNPLLLLIALSFYIPAFAQKPAFVRTLERIAENVSPATATININNTIASYDDMLKLQDTAILKVEVYAKKEAIKMVGREGGKNGLILITLRKKAMEFPRKSKYVYRDNGDSLYCENQIPATLDNDTTQASWIKFLQKNLRADTPIENGSPAGIYYVDFTFIVDTVGTVKDIKIPEDPGYGCGTETMRLMKQSPKWIPGMCDSLIVNFKAKQRVTFVVSAY